MAVGVEWGAGTMLPESRRTEWDRTSIRGTVSVANGEMWTIDAAVATGIHSCVIVLDFSIEYREWKNTVRYLCDRKYNAFI